MDHRETEEVKNHFEPVLVHYFVLIYYLITLKDGFISRNEQ